MQKWPEKQRCSLKVSSANNSCSGSDSIFSKKGPLPDRPFQPAQAVAEFEDGEGDSDLEDPCLEIVEQSQLNHFISVLQNAQRVAARAERENPQKRPTTYDGRSKSTQKRRKKQKKDHEKQGYLSVFDYIALKKEEAEKRAQTEELVTREVESDVAQIEQESEESAPVSDTENLDLMSCSVSRRVGHRQVRCGNINLMILMTTRRPVCSQIRRRRSLRGDDK